MVDENVTLIHSDDYCVIMQSNDPREQYLGNPVQLMEQVWCNQPNDCNEYRTNLRSEHYGKRVFYVYCMSDQIVEFKVVDLAVKDRAYDPNDIRCSHPLLVDGGIVMTPLKNKHEILEYVLFDELVGKRDEE
jgi:hypothetical protein